jgi:5-methylcytosine-specific restriction endonuclease McrA
MTRLAVDLPSGPAGLAALLRQSLLDQPWNTPSLPLDTGYSESIPGHIRRAVQLRDQHCTWPRCDRPAACCDVHHLRRKADGGETSLANCALLCQLCRHRHNWRRSPAGAPTTLS